MSKRFNLRSVLWFLLCVLIVPTMLAQQTGEIVGRVESSDGASLAGVKVEATSPVLPLPRVSTTDSNGYYRMPLLPPDDYTLTFRRSGLASQTRLVRVFLNQAATAHVVLGMEGVTETITVSAQASLVDATTAEIKSALGQEVFQDLPIGQDYRDLVKLTPALMYTEDSVRGPSAGGNGQDNVYNFDGVNVSLPLFGTLSTEQSTVDIQQVAVTKGGAQAQEFNRAGGFFIDSVSRSGTNEFHGELAYQVQTDAMKAGEKTLGEEFAEDKDWASFSLGGPVLKDRVFFYGSYYRPTEKRTERITLYGDAPDRDRERDEYFGKLTFTPTRSILINGSYRSAETTEVGNLGGSAFAGSSATNAHFNQDIAILEGSWIVNNRSFVTFKYNDFSLETGAEPQVDLGFIGTRDPTSVLDVNHLDRMGFLEVPAPVPGQTAFNQFIAPLIERYGYLQNGVRVGGGRVGTGQQFGRNDFFRDGFLLAYDYSYGTTMNHQLHVGYQRYEDEEFLAYRSNGWGFITVQGGRNSFEGQPVFYRAEFIRNEAAGGVVVPGITSSYESQNFELNDNIRWNNLTFNVGVLVSQDTLFGQGLREDPSALSGYVLAPGNRYRMYTVDWNQMIQPRAGMTWAYNGRDSVYASYARYHSAASSLPRAASWERNLSLTSVWVHFDAEGRVIGSQPRNATAGKLFADDLDPRFIDEFIVGTSQTFDSRWTGRLYGRYRYAANFWEDTNNNARVAFNPPEGIPQELYDPDYVTELGQIGTGGSNSSYIIAELDGAFTRYYEASVEGEWRGDRAFIRGSYTWSHYYGNFDQDNTALGNDTNIFIGSSNIADGAGRQIWDFRYGDLRGDRRHIVKVYGVYQLPWNATTGAFALFQSGQPWEQWSYLPYTSLTSSTSSVNRYAEPAGSRTTDDHYQLDLNYTHNFLVRGFNIQLDLDVFNVFDNQTGYNPDPIFNSPTFGQSRAFYDPRRFQLGVRFQF
jgi:hypothetical protein